MSQSILFIGVGNMGQAIASQVIRKKIFDTKNIFLYDKDTAKTKKGLLKQAQTLEELSDLSKFDIIFLAVKPNQINDVLKNLEIKKDTLIISIAAGFQIAQIQKNLTAEQPIIRVMPNMNAMINRGISALSVNSFVDDKQKQTAHSILSSVGKVLEVKEDLLDAVTGLSGSGPAYVFMFIQSLADGGVKMGIPREQAYELALHTVLGSAENLLKSKLHPEVLKDKIASPGGTTIAAIHSLEKNKFRASVIEAVETATLKSKELGK